MTHRQRSKKSEGKRGETVMKLIVIYETFFCIISDDGLAFYLLHSFVLIHIHVVLHLSCLSNKKIPVMKERLNFYTLKQVHPYIHQY